MGTLRSTKLEMKLNKDFRQMMVKGSRNEILLDLDGDQSPDIALIDENHDGDIDTIAVDLTGDSEFNLYIRDTDHNGIIDAVYYNEDGEEEVIVQGDEVEDAIITAAAAVNMLLQIGDYASDILSDALADLDKQVKAAQKEAKRVNKALKKMQ